MYFWLMTTPNLIYEFKERKSFDFSLLETIQAFNSAL